MWKEGDTFRINIPEAQRGRIQDSWPQAGAGSLPGTAGVGQALPGRALPWRVRLLGLQGFQSELIGV